MAELPKVVKAYLASITSKGGRARAKALTPKRRRAIAKQAADARWHPKKRGGRASAPTRRRLH